MTYKVTLTLDYLSGDNPIEAIQQFITGIQGEEKTLCYNVAEYETGKQYIVNIEENIVEES